MMMNGDVFFGEDIQELGIISASGPKTWWQPEHDAYFQILYRPPCH